MNLAFSIKWFASWFVFILSPSQVRTRKEIEAIPLWTAVAVSIVALIALFFVGLALTPSD